MAEIKTKEINGRYIFPGNLKLDNEAIKSLGKNEYDIVIDIMTRYKDKLLESFQFKNDVCISYQLSIHRTLFIDYRKGNVNFFIVDEEQKLITQLLNKNEVLKLVRAQVIISKIIERSTQDKEKNRYEMLMATLVNAAQQGQVMNKGHPTVFLKRLDKDLDIDR